MADIAHQPPAQLTNAQLDMTHGGGGSTSRAAQKIGNKIAQVPEQACGAVVGTLAAKACDALKKLILPK